MSYEVTICGKCKAKKEFSSKEISMCGKCFCMTKTITETLYTDLEVKSMMNNSLPLLSLKNEIPKEGEEVILFFTNKYNRKTNICPRKIRGWDVPSFKSGDSIFTHFIRIPSLPE